MKFKFLFFLPAFLLMANQSTAQTTNVFINGVELSLTQTQSVEQYYRVKIQKGRYWYDSTCGLWGLEGEGVTGLILPNLNLGGQLKSNASKGRTGLFINGRQVNRKELLQWKGLLGTVNLGRYWMDAYGNVGFEGGAYLFNVVQLQNRNRSQNSFWRSTTTGIGTGGSGSSFYVIGKDFSY